MQRRFLRLETIENLSERIIGKTVAHDKRFRFCTKQDLEATYFAEVLPLIVVAQLA